MAINSTTPALLVAALWKRGFFCNEQRERDPSLTLGRYNRMARHDTCLQCRDSLIPRVKDNARPGCLIQCAALWAEDDPKCNLNQ
jgi:hypothetical protein